MSERDIPVPTDLLRRWERDFQATRDDVIGLKQSHSNMSTDISDIRIRDIAELKQQLQGLSGRFDESNKTNWPFIGALIAAVPILYVVMISLISNSIAPVMSDYQSVKTRLESISSDVHDIGAKNISQDRLIEAATQQAAENSTNIKALLEQQGVVVQRAAASAEADSNSRTDRSQLNDRVGKLETGLAMEIADRRSVESMLRTNMGEIETQFHAVSDIGNIEKGHQQQVNALIWYKVFGQTYPTGGFFPTSMFQPDGLDYSSPQQHH